jgi:hypothetical protein
MLNVKHELEDLPKKFWEAAEAAAKAETTFKNLDDNKKSILAKVKNRILFEKLGEKISEASLERLAYADKEFTDFMEGLYQARESCLTKQAKYDTIKAYLDILRSLNSSYKAEMNLT